MYISVNDRPVDRSEPTEGQRGKVAPIVISLGFVSLLTDISSESVAAILPLYLTSVIGLSTVAYGVALLGLLVPDHRPRAARAELGEARQGDRSGGARSQIHA